MRDTLLEKFFEKDRWETAIDVALKKGIDKNLLRQMCTPEYRLKLYEQIKHQTYEIIPPHEARIPKDDGSYRTVYVNTNADRVILSIINDMLFQLCPEMIHPSCKSYQKGIGCGKIVQTVSRTIQTTDSDEIGVKVDLSKYFDSVPIEYIDDIFNKIEYKFGKSDIMCLVKNYYHTDTVIDFDKNLVEKYSSLRQGCAIAAFLADAILYDIDEHISKNFNAYYVRYSDDILIVGPDWKNAYDALQKMLSDKTLILNPKKVEILHKDVWFKFLGFNIKGERISLSNTRIKTFQKEIENRTINSESNDISTIISDVNRFLYNVDGEYSWATSVLPIINVEKDVQTLNAFVMDAIRAAVTKKHKIGGLGCYNQKNVDFSIMRGKGKHVSANKTKIPRLNSYLTLNCAQNALLTSKPVYETLIRSL
ncbi:hypothetical protein J6A31_06175 [bacterium]|nr:hypothetical protein [bacterium]